MTRAVNHFWLVLPRCHYSCMPKHLFKKSRWCWSNSRQKQCTSRSMSSSKVVIWRFMFACLNMLPKITLQKEGKTMLTWLKRLRRVLTHRLSGRNDVTFIVSQYFNVVFVVPKSQQFLQMVLSFCWFTRKLQSFLNHRFIVMTWFHMSRKFSETLNAKWTILLFVIFPVIFSVSQF